MQYLQNPDLVLFQDTKITTFDLGVIDNLIKYQSLLSKNIPLDFKDISNRIKYFKSSQKPIPKLLDEKQDTDVLEISKDGKKQSTPSKDVFVKHTGKLSFKRVSSKSFTSPKNIDKTNFSKSSDDFKSNVSNL